MPHLIFESCRRAIGYVGSAFRSDEPPALTRSGGAKSGVLPAAPGLTNATAQDNLSTQPACLIHHIASYLPPGAKLNLARANKQLYRTLSNTRQLSDARLIQNVAQLKERAYRGKYGTTERMRRVLRELEALNSDPLAVQLLMRLAENQLSLAKRGQPLDGDGMFAISELNRLSRQLRPPKAGASVQQTLRDVQRTLKYRGLWPAPHDESGNATHRAFSFDIR